MKVVLLQPPVQDFYDTDIRLQPLGLAYLKAAAQKYFPEAQIILKDYHHGWGRRTVPIPRELHYLREFYQYPDQSPFSTFYHYTHFGADFDAIERDVAGEAPDLVGISSLFSPYYREAVECARRIKQKLRVPILMGGSHVSAMPEETLKSPWVDFVIVGEGEKPFVEFLKAFSVGKSFEKVPNLGFKSKGEFIWNPTEENYPIEDIPIPDLSDFEPGKYLFEKQPLTFLITSRSCPHRCSFCSVHQTFGIRYRRRSVENVLAEIRKRYDDGIRVFDFEDDNLTYYQKEMKLLCEKLIEAFPGKDVRFLAMNGISYLSLNKELLGLMHQAGFTHLNLALVSSDTTVRETTKRPHTVEKYLETVREAARLGFKTVSYQILGLPNESLDSMIQTLSFEADLPVLLGASMFYLTPNSPIAKPFGSRTEEDVFRSRLTAMAIETDHFKRQDLFTLFITTRILNFLKGLRFEAPEISLEDALRGAGDSTDKRTRLGSVILENLLTEGRLCAATKKGFQPVSQFKPDLFFQVWKTIGSVGTLDGKKIKIPAREKVSRVLQSA